MLEAGVGIEVTDDVRVQRAVAIAARQRAGDMVLRFETGVGDAARLRVIAESIEPELTSACAAVVGTAVRDVHNEARGIELRLRETFACEPGEVTGAAGRGAGEISGNDLILAFIAQFGLCVRLNGNDIRLG